MNIEYLLAALLPSYIMFLALMIANAYCAWVDYFNTPVTRKPDHYAWIERNERPDVHAVMRELRMKDD